MGFGFRRMTAACLASCAGEIGSPDLVSNGDGDAGVVGVVDTGGGQQDSTDAGATVDMGAIDGGRMEPVAPGAPDAGSVASPGCQRIPAIGPGGVQLEESFGEAAGGRRSYLIVLPERYDPELPHKVIVAYAGTNWSGEMIRPYFNLDARPAPGEIHVYPDLQFHDFGGQGPVGGWLLGPLAAPFDGMADIEFTRALLDRLGERYCVDPDRIFATGHSWGGDMAAVVGCFLGDRFRAVAPAAANRPYWFEPESQLSCEGESAVWTFFGTNETHFTWQDRPGQFGEEQHAFWMNKDSCDEGTEVLPYDQSGACVRSLGCDVDTRLCLYEPSAGHQIPSYFAEAVLDWFRSF